MSLKTRSMELTRKVTIDWYVASAASRVPACRCGRAAYALAGGVGGEAARTHRGREGEAPRAWPEEGATRAPLNGGAT